MPGLHQLFREALIRHAQHQLPGTGQRQELIKDGACSRLLWAQLQMVAGVGKDCSVKHVASDLALVPASGGTYGSAMAGLCDIDSARLRLAWTNLPE